MNSKKKESGAKGRKRRHEEEEKGELEARNAKKIFSKNFNAGTLWKKSSMGAQC